MTVLPVLPLVIRGLRVSFARTTGVARVDLEVPARAVVALVGPNGSGKTTTLRAVLGLVRPDEGSVLVDGHAGGTVAARARIAYAPDEPAGLDELSVREFGDLVAALWRAGPTFDRRREVLLDAFALGGHNRMQLGALSHGQRRLVAIATAVALERTLVLVAEAPPALAPEAALVLREVLRAEALRGAGVLLATQDLHFAETTCDRVVLLSAGRVAASGTLAAVLAAHGATGLGAAYVAAVGAEQRLDEVRDALGRL